MKRRITRRRVLGCCAAGLGVVALDALVLEPRWLDVERWDVDVEDLAHAHEGLRIAHVSDLHLTSVSGIHEKIARELRGFDPHLTFVTGDTVESEEDLGALEDFTALLVDATMRPILATSGNWEHWGHVPREKLAAAYDRAGGRHLSNEAPLVDGLRVVAIDDFCSGNADASSAMKKAEGAAPRLVVTHAPGLFDELPAAFPDFALALAGHTHGGQLCAFGQAIWTPPGSGSYVEGRYETARGPLIVSRGVGMSVLGARLTCRPQISLVTLRRA